LFDPILRHFYPKISEYVTGKAVHGSEKYLGWIGARGVQCDLHLSLKALPTKIYLEADENRGHSKGRGNKFNDKQTNQLYVGAYTYDMHIQFEKDLAVGKATPLGSVIIHVNADNLDLKGGDVGGDIRRGQLTWIIQQYIDGKKIVEPNNTHWWFVDMPAKRLFNEAQFIIINTTKVVSVNDVRGTKEPSTISGLVELDKAPYPQSLFDSPIIPTPQHPQTPSKLKWASASPSFPWLRLFETFSLTKFLSLS